jgi:hypothetical protein
MTSIFSDGILIVCIPLWMSTPDIEELIQVSHSGAEAVITWLFVYSAKNPLKHS